MAQIIDFAGGIEAANFPPIPTYVRAAGAKPQSKLRVARKTGGK